MKKPGQQNDGHDEEKASPVSVCRAASELDSFKQNMLNSFFCSKKVQEEGGI